MHVRHPLSASAYGDPWGAKYEKIAYPNRTDWDWMEPNGDGSFLMSLPRACNVVSAVTERYTF